MAYFNIYLLNRQQSAVIKEFECFFEGKLENRYKLGDVIPRKESLKESVKISHIELWDSTPKYGPTWLNDFNKISGSSIRKSINKRTSAFILINVKYENKDYLYAITWGEAFRFFETICVKNFGLTIAKKTVNHNEITNASVIGQFPSGRSATATSHKPSSIGTLRMFASEEKFIKLSGRIDEESISITGISGKNSLVISQPSNTKSLFSALEKITEIYINGQPNPELSILDYFTDVSDSELSTILPTLQQSMSKGKFQLSFSENFANALGSELNTSNLLFVREGSKYKPKYFSSQDGLYSLLSRFLKERKTSLKLMNKYIIRSEDNRLYFPLEDILNIFIEEDITNKNGVKFNYTFSGSTWTKFNSELSDSINKKLQHIKFYEHEHIKWTSNIICCEAGYNEKFAKEHGGLLIDAKLPKIKGFKGSSFELADIALNEEGTNRYIATKRINNSSDVSYLFNQGMVSSSAASKLFRGLNSPEYKNFLAKESSWYRNNKFEHDPEKTTTFSYLMVLDSGKCETPSNDKIDVLNKLPFFYRITILNTLEFCANYGINMEIAFIPYEDNGKLGKGHLCRKCSAAGEQFKSSLEDTLSGTQFKIDKLKFLFNPEGEIKNNLKSLQKTKIFILDLLKASKRYEFGPETIIKKLNAMEFKKMKELSTKQSPEKYIQTLGLKKL